MKRFISGLSSLLWLVIGTVIVFMMVIVSNTPPGQEAFAETVVIYLLWIMYVGFALQLLLGMAYVLHWFLTTDHTADFVVEDNFSEGSGFKRRKPSGF